MQALGAPAPSGVRIRLPRRTARAPGVRRAALGARTRPPTPDARTGGRAPPRRTLGRGRGRRGGGAVRGAPAGRRAGPGRVRCPGNRGEVGLTSAGCAMPARRPGPALGARVSGGCAACVAAKLPARPSWRAGPLRTVPASEAVGRAAGRPALPPVSTRLACAVPPRERRPGAARGRGRRGAGAPPRLRRSAAQRTGVVSGQRRAFPLPSFLGSRDLQGSARCPHGVSAVFAFPAPGSGLW